jgi:hypothetical protein
LKKNKGNQTKNIAGHLLNMVEKKIIMCVPVHDRTKNNGFFLDVLFNAIWSIKMGIDVDFFKLHLQK